MYQYIYFVIPIHQYCSAGGVFYVTQLRSKEIHSLK